MTLSDVEDVVQLITHDRLVADRPSQDPFVNHDPYRGWPIAVQNHLPPHPSLHATLDLVRGRVRSRTEQASGVRRSLQKTGDQQWVPSTQDDRLGFDLLHPPQVPAWSRRSLGDLFTKSDEVPALGQPEDVVQSLGLAQLRRARPRFQTRNMRLSDSQTCSDRSLRESGLLSEPTQLHTKTCTRRLLVFDTAIPHMSSHFRQIATIHRYDSASPGMPERRHDSPAGSHHSKQKKPGPIGILTNESLSGMDNRSQHDLLSP